MVTSEFVSLVRLIERFVHDCTEVTGRQCPTLRSSLLSQVSVHLCTPSFVALLAHIYTVYSGSIGAYVHVHVRVCYHQPTPSPSPSYSGDVIDANLSSPTYRLNHFWSTFTRVGSPKWGMLMCHAHFTSSVQFVLYTCISAFIWKLVAGRREMETSRCPFNNTGTGP